MPTPRLGGKQVACLLAYRAAARFRPGRSGRPWATMRSLIRRGFMWAEIRSVQRWSCDAGAWVNDGPPQHWAGLTRRGLEYLEELGAKHG